MDQFTPLWVQNKYTTQASPIPIATGDEARLIIAGWPAVRRRSTSSTPSGLGPRCLSSKSMIPRIQTQVIEERRRELFLEGHHLGDVNRLGLPLTPPDGTSYPPKAGGSYGNTVCFPLPAIERLNNPNIDG